MTDAKEILEDFHVDLDLREGDLVTDVIVLTRVQRFEGDETLDAIVAGSTRHSGGIVTHGMLTVAVVQSEHYLQTGPEGEDD